MPGRATGRMTPQDVYSMSTSRFDVPLQVLTNKKALDDAFRQHVWKKQSEKAGQASAERRTKMTGEYGLKRQELANIGRTGKGGDQTSRAASLATQIMAKSLDFDPGSPEYQQAWEETFRSILNQMTGETGDADSLATAGQAEAPLLGTAISAGTITGRAPVRERMLKKRETLKGRKRAQPGKTQTAVNPSTGERLEFRGGQWVPIR